MAAEQRRTPSVERRSLDNMTILRMLPPTAKTITHVATYKKCAASQCSQCADGSCLGYCPSHFGDLYRAEKIDIDSTGGVQIRATQEELTSFLEWTSSVPLVQDGGCSVRHRQRNYSSAVLYTHKTVDEQQRQHPAALTAVSAGQSTQASPDPQTAGRTDEQTVPKQFDTDPRSPSFIRELIASLLDQASLPAAPQHQIASETMYAADGTGEQTVPKQFDTGPRSPPGFDPYAPGMTLSHSEADIQTTLTKRISAMVDDRMRGEALGHCDQTQAKVKDFP